MIESVSKSLLTYGIFRLTRGIAKNGMDSFGGLAGKFKATTCEECGRVFAGGVLTCPVCNVEMEKLYFEYQKPENGPELVDKGLEV